MSSGQRACVGVGSLRRTKPECELVSVPVFEKAIMQMIYGRPEEGIRRYRKEHGERWKSGREKERVREWEGVDGSVRPLARYRIVTRAFTRRLRASAELD